MQILISQALLLLLVLAVPSLGAPSRNLTSLASESALPYPKGYSTKTCPDNGNAWTNSQSPKNRVRSSVALDENPSVVAANTPSSVPVLSVKRRQASSLCSGIARQNFNFNGVGGGYRTADILLQAGIQYVISFSSNTAVLGVTVFQEPIGTALSHVISHPNFARTVSGTLSITLQQAANVWMVVKFANGLPAQGQLGIFALGTPSDLNLEAGSGGLRI